MTPEPTLIGRLWDPDVSGPCVVTVRGGVVLDITSPRAPLVRDICEMVDPAGYVARAEGREVGRLEDLLALGPAGLEARHLLAPCDLQAVKACGVTFAGSMVERVIEERAAGDPSKAEAIRARVGAAIGESLMNIRPSTPEAMAAKAALIAEGLWSPPQDIGSTCKRLRKSWG